MRFTIGLFAIGIAVVSAIPADPQRIVGGSEATINQYPAIAGVLYSRYGVFFWVTCGGTILTNRAILTAAHCVVNDPISWFRVRVGSTYASSGGLVYLLNNAIIHPSYNQRIADNDIALVHTSELLAFSDTIQPTFIPGSNYVVGDNQVVWAAGWGFTSENGFLSDHLNHVQIWTVNQEVCAENYFHEGRTVTENMLCAGWLNVGGRDQCTGDYGGPLYQANVVIGISSWGLGCGRPEYPGVNTRLTQYTEWIQANA